MIKLVKFYLNNQTTVIKDAPFTLSAPLSGQTITIRVEETKTGNIGHLITLDASDIPKLQAFIDETKATYQKMLKEVAP